MTYACQKHGKFPGMGSIYQDDLLANYVDMDMHFILLGTDLGSLMAGAQTRIRALRSIELP